MTRQEFDAACKRADESMKASDGHQFLTILKTRCQFCGRSPRQKGKCPAWVNTFVDHLYHELFIAATPPASTPEEHDRHA